MNDTVNEINIFLKLKFLNSSKNSKKKCYNSRKGERLHD